MNKASSSPPEQEDDFLNRWTDRLVRGDWRLTAVLFLVLVAFYLVTAAGNISETDDVYAFAYRAENFPVDHLSDPRLMLYHVAMRLLFVGSGAVGLDVSALSLMRWVSVLSAAAALILMLRILCIDLRLSAATAVLATVILAISYGFWRYAAEAEVYVPAIFLILLVFRGLLSARDAEGAGVNWSSLPSILGWGLLAGLTVLFYQPSAIPLFLAFPLLLLYRHSIVQLGCYFAGGGLVIVAGYLIGFLVYWPEPLAPEAFSRFLAQRAGEFMVPPLSLRTVIVSMIRAAFALGHDLVSANWIFAFDPVTQLVQKAFSNNVITEEVYLAKQAGFLAYLPIATLAALAVISLRILPVLWRPSLAFLKERAYLAVLLWAGINGAVIGRLNPAGLEAWIMVFPPLIMLFAALVVQPCLDRGRRGLVATFAALVFLHNALGGMALVHDPANEFDRAKGSWVIAEAKPADLVIVVNNAGLGETLRYLSPARVALIGPFQATTVAQSLLQNDLNGLFTQTRGRDFDGFFLRELIAETWRSGGRLILFDHFFQLPGPDGARDPPALSPLSELKAETSRVYEAPGVGATYVLPAPIQ